MEKESRYFKDSIDATLGRHQQLAEFVDMLDAIETGLKEVDFQAFDTFDSKLLSLTRENNEWTQIAGPGGSDATTISTGGYDEFVHDGTRYSTRMLKVVSEPRARKDRVEEWYFLGVVPVGATELSDDDFPLKLSTEDGKIALVMGRHYWESSTEEYKEEYASRFNILDDAAEYPPEDIDSENVELHRVGLAEFIKATEQLAKS